MIKILINGKPGAWEVVILEGKCGEVRYVDATPGRSLLACRAAAERREERISAGKYCNDSATYRGNEFLFGSRSPRARRNEIGGLFGEDVAEVERTLLNSES